jgi:hypothetical protein
MIFCRKIIKTSSFAIFLIQITLALLLLLPSFILAGQPETVDDAISTKTIGFDIAISNGQYINIVWTNDQTIVGQVQTLHYQSSHNAGNSWSKPFTLVTTGEDLIINPKIYAIGDTLLVFWQFNNLYLRQSTDGGKSWDETVASISDSNILNGNIGRYHIFLNNGVLYVIYSDYVRHGNSATYFTKSSDLGKSWKEPVPLAPYIKATESQDPISIDVSGKNIHAVCQMIERKPGLSISKVYSAYSDDLGDNWYPTKNLDISNWEEETDASVPTSDFRIVSQEDRLFLFFQKQYYWFYMVSTNNGDTWSKPEMVTGGPALQYSLNKSPSGAIDIIWIDQRNQNRDWWGYIPLVEVLTLGADPYWDNNDLYHAIFEKGGIKNIERLTPQSAFVEPYISTGVNSIACENFGNQLAIFWAGKKKIGKSSIASPEPYKIFKRILAPRKDK